MSSSSASSSSPITATTRAASSNFVTSGFDSKITEELDAGLLWPEPLIQLNPSYEPGGLIDELVDRTLLHQGCAPVFRRLKDEVPGGLGLRLHRHQVDAIEAARRARTTS